MNANLIASVIGAVICLGAWTWGWYSIGFKLGREREIENEIQANRQFTEWMGKKGDK